MFVLSEKPIWTGFEMSDYFNADGEPLMSGVDMMRDGYYSDEYDVDRFYDLAAGGWEPEPVDPSVCEHGNGGLPEGAGFDCDDCGELYHGPRMRPESEWAAGGFWTYGE
jgi:hypothetical protein